MSFPLRVLMPARIVDRHVGGNTTYARELEKGLLERGIPTGRIPMGRNAVETLIRETREGRRGGEAGDVLHYTSDTGPLLPTRRPSLLTLHGVASRWVSVARNPVQEATWRTRVRAAIATTQRLVTVSESSRNDIAEVFGVPTERISVIYHGIECDQYATPHMLSAGLAHLLARPFVLYLGNIEPRKNLVAAVDAFESARVRALGVPLVIAGKPAWNSTQTMERLETATNVTHVGFVSDSDRVALMQACRLFLFPSLYEGFGFPVLEAMAAGAPVLTSRRGSLAEVAGPASVIDDLSSEGIAAGVVAALSGETDAAAAEAGRAWVRRFTWDASVEAHLAIYRELAAR